MEKSRFIGFSIKEKKSDKFLDISTVLNEFSISEQLETVFILELSNKYFNFTNFLFVKLDKYF